MAFNYRGIRPARPWFPPDRWMARLQFGVFSEFFPNILRDGRLRLFGRRARIPEAKGTQDYFGLNYYTDDEVSFTLDPRVYFGRRRFPLGAELSPNNFMANTPQGFWRAIQWACSFGLPIYITENGIEDAVDGLRPRYLVEHLHQLWRAVNFNYPIRGYFHWALLDNFEWDRGWTQRFGLWELDTASQARRKRPSAELYAAICEANGISSEAVRKYAPAAFEKMFPG
jgi:beta-glucosidase